MLAEQFELTRSQFFRRAPCRPALLAGRTVILTGAAGGIGRHVARALAAPGRASR